MLPVAKPQHYNSRDPRHPPDPYPYHDTDSTLGMMGDTNNDNNNDIDGDFYHTTHHQEMQQQSLYEQQQQQQELEQELEQRPDTPMSSLDLETFKQQKILEFRAALEKELERKRQQAQKELQDAERQKWLQLMEFQQALEQQQLLQQQQQQQYMGESSAAISAMEQHRMSLLGEALPPQHYENYHDDQNDYDYDYDYQDQSARMGVNYNSSLPQHDSMARIPNSPLHAQYLNNLGFPPNLLAMQYHSRYQSPMRSRFPPPSPYHSYPQRHPQSYYTDTGYENNHNTNTNISGGDIWRSRGPPAAQGADHHFDFEGLDGDANPNRHGISAVGSAAAAMMERTASYQQRKYDSTSGNENRIQPSVTWAPNSPTNHRMDSPLRGGIGRPSEWAPSSPQRRGSPLRGSMTRPLPSEWTSTSPQRRRESPMRGGAMGLSPTRRYGSPFRGNSVRPPNNWNPQSPSGRIAGTRGPSTMSNNGGSHERVNQADELEREYCRLTGKPTVTSRESALAHVKQLQEERRRKLAALTKRVVDNRRRVAHEMKTVDRPLEISFEERREEDQAIRSSSQSDTRDEGNNSKMNDENDTMLNKILEEDEHEGETTRAASESDEDDDSQIRGKSNKADQRSSVESDDSGVACEEKKSHLDKDQDRGSRYFLKIVEESKANSTSNERHDKTKDKSKANANVLSNEGTDGTIDEAKQRPQDESKKGEPTPGKEKKKNWDRKGRESASNFVAELRQKRFQAVEDSNTYDIQKTYSRQDVWTALEADRTKQVTLPARDPKAARINRKNASQRLLGRQERTASVSRDQDVKIAKKKSPTRFRADIKSSIRKEKEPTGGLDPILEGKQSTAHRHKGSSLSQTLERNNKQQVEHKIHHNNNINNNNNGSRSNLGQNMELSKSAATNDLKNSTYEEMSRNPVSTTTRKQRNTRGSSAMSLISDLSESAYGGATSYTGSGINFGENEDESDTPDDLATEEGHDCSDTTHGQTSNTGDDVDETEESSPDAGGDNDLSKSSTDTKTKNIKVRDLTIESYAEGFEIEEGFDLQSVHSRSVYSRVSNAKEPHEETQKKLETLEQLENKMEEKDFRGIVPELLEFTDVHGWDVQKVVNHFMRSFPRIADNMPLKGVTGSPAQASAPTSLMKTNESRARMHAKETRSPGRLNESHPSYRKSPQQNHYNNIHVGPASNSRTRVSSPPNSNSIPTSPRSPSLMMVQSEPFRPSTPLSPRTRTARTAAIANNLYSNSPSKNASLRAVLPPARNLYATSPPQNAYIRAASPPTIRPQSPKQHTVSQVGQVQPKLPDNQDLGWRARVKYGASKLRSHDGEGDSIDMKNVRTSLRSLSRRSRHTGGGGVGLRK